MRDSLDRSVQQIVARLKAAVILVDPALRGVRGEDVVARAVVVRPGVPVAVRRKPFKPSQLVAS
jgi:hypothetical protein